ncbi:hypothetical protein SPV_2498 [Streptococcus pneumoniae]|nr:hypothetical protein SPV_2498 [Streptococcus pneumoniae]
MYSRLNLK